jgi:hypothetical protein
MFNKINKIAKAWITAANPTPKQNELAEKRYNICIGCEYYGKSRPVTGDEYCTDCLCPISKKIFTQNNDECPKHYWLEVEAPYFKKEKTLL